MATRFFDAFAPNERLAAIWALLSPSESGWGTWAFLLISAITGFPVWRTMVAVRLAVAFARLLFEAMAAATFLLTITLAGFALVGTALAGFTLAGATLVGAAFAGAALVGATLVAAALVGAALVGAALGDITLTGVTLAALGLAIDFSTSLTLPDFGVTLVATLAETTLPAAAAALGRPTGFAEGTFTLLTAVDDTDFLRKLCFSTMRVSKCSVTS